MDQALRMDRMYTVQRHFYDATRRYYLLGRDRLLQRLPVPLGGSVLELGCGTGRNLAELRQLRPDLRLCGLDVSERMLETAQRKLSGQDVKLATCPAEELDPKSHFGSEELFDAVFYSYSLSMIPNWNKALEAGWAALKTGGTLAVVDFWGQGGLPAWLEWMHTRWLGLFKVQFRPELITYLREMEKQGRGWMELESVRKGYAFLAWVRKLTA
ncbi:MAG: class I SAM-dependent methyltransferase [Desulfovibrio sp.]|nr:class I SAM-dependent methyltransferase [Desulfovibrio sp.]MBI4959469.1 class I SAM-dependent methyltransferase [Desulfovibrio sp.]